FGVCAKVAVCADGGIFGAAGRRGGFSSGVNFRRGGAAAWAMAPPVRARRPGSARGSVIERGGDSVEPRTDFSRFGRDHALADQVHGDWTECAVWCPRLYEQPVSVVSWAARFF